MAPAASPDEVPCLIARDDLNRRTAELGQQISADYRGKELVLVGVLKGAFVFMADLARALTIPACCDFVKISSYGMGTKSSGEIRLHFDLSLPLEGRHVLLVEDIVDTGTSIAWLLDHLRKHKPASVRLCALLDKPSRRRTPVTIDYLGFTIPDRFVVGFGIDFAERHRQLPYVGYLPSGEKHDGNVKSGP
jgi:hypoxanthine phosphoribosyltransferase